MSNNKSAELQKVLDESRCREAEFFAAEIRNILLKSKTDLFGRPRNESVDIMNKKKFKK